jgi:hypothetical protein
MLEKLPITPENWTSLKLQMSDVIMRQIFVNEKLNTEQPKINTIYHYTNLNNFISIVENQTLYCTNISFLNDKREYKYGVDLLLGRIDILKDSGFNVEILDMLTKHIDLIFKSERYVTCFSKNGDLLSQWRAYANNGKGVAIGFESMMIERRMNLILQRQNVTYDVKEQTEILDELIKIMINFFEDHKEIFDWSEFGYEWLVVNAIIELLDNIISGFKDPAFFEEQEHRLEYIIDGNMNKREDVEINYRASETQIIPYIKFISEYRRTEIDKEKGRYDNIDIDDTEIFHLKRRLPIHEIIIGPSLDYEMNKLAIEDMLKKNGYNDVVIRKSTIPYRL